MSTFPVSEIFESLQGEGNAAGRKSLFIRFHFCNLTCSWCDTKYTWLTKSGAHESQGRDQLKEIIRLTNSKNIIFTGGEPSLQPLDELYNPDKIFHVESNGTVIPTKPLDLTLTDGTRLTRSGMDLKIISNWNWVISPKLSNSKQTLNTEAINWWSKQSFAIFKFILSKVEDLFEIENFIAEYGIAKDQCFIGLEGQTLESQLRGDFVDLILQKGFHFSPRLHVLLWGKARKK